MQHNCSMKKLKSSPGAQTIIHSALMISGYVSNIPEKWQKNIYCFALNISEYIIIIH